MSFRVLQVFGVPKPGFKEIGAQKSADAKRLTFTKAVGHSANSDSREADFWVLPLQNVIPETVVEQILLNVGSIVKGLRTISVTLLCPSISAPTTKPIPAYLVRGKEAGELNTKLINNSTSQKKTLPAPIEDSSRLATDSSMDNVETALGSCTLDDARSIKSQSSSFSLSSSTDGRASLDGGAISPRPPKGCLKKPGQRSAPKTTSFKEELGYDIVTGEPVPQSTMTGGEYRQWWAHEINDQAGEGMELRKVNSESRVEEKRPERPRRPSVIKRKPTTKRTGDSRWGTMC